jgi:hypothetical protein
MTTSPSIAHLALSPEELSSITRGHAALFTSGAYPFVAYTPGERWHRRIHCDDLVDVWLISWLPSQATELHDHGGSCGAFTVATGELTELLPARSTSGEHVLCGLRRAAGRTVGFGADHVHDVVNRAGIAAVSVHAYSPPLSSMGYYRLTPQGLDLTRTVVTDDPEAGSAA